MLPLARLATLVFALVLPDPGSAQITCARGHPLVDLLARADAVVAGEIVAVEEDDAVLAVERRIAGTGVPDRVAYRQLPTEVCGIWRWAPYAKGQRVVLFLLEHEGAFHVLGNGEWPLVEADVIVSGERIEGYAEEEHRIGDAYCTGSRVPLEELAGAVRAFRQTFSFEYEHGTYVNAIECRDLDAARELRAASRTGLHVVEMATASRHFRPYEPPPPFPVRTRRLESPDDAWGNAVAFVGDVDGNGVDDLAVGASVESGRGGALRVVLMRSDIDVEREVLVELPMRVSAQIAPLGDVDGDGVPDLAARVLEPDAAGSATGLLVVFLGREGNVRRSVEIAGAEMLRHAGSEAECGLGAALACVGDLDGDGGPELVASLAYPTPQAPSALSPEWMDREWMQWVNGDERRVERQAYLESEHHAALVLSLDRDGSLRWARAIGRCRVGDAAENWLGAASYAGVGDVTGDGVPDLAAGKPWSDLGAESRGEVWIVPLQADGGALRGRRIRDLTGAEPAVLREGGRFGSALAAPGDVNGDGVPDLVVAGADTLHVLLLGTEEIVKRHTAVRIPPQRESALCAVGRSLACRPATGQAGPVLAVGGLVGRDWRRYRGATFLLRIDADGTLRGL